jgi:hypothetical protein
MGGNDMDDSIVNYAGLGVCFIAIVMLFAAYSKVKTKAYKARRAARKG